MGSFYDVDVLSPPRVTERLEDDLDGSQATLYPSRCGRCALQFSARPNPGPRGIRCEEGDGGLSTGVHVPVVGVALFSPTTDRGEGFEAAVVDELVRRGDVLHLIHLVGRLGPEPGSVRSGDRRRFVGSRLPLLAIAWSIISASSPTSGFIYGNHDALLA